MKKAKGDKQSLLDKEAQKREELGRLTEIVMEHIMSCDPQTKKLEELPVLPEEVEALLENGQVKIMKEDEMSEENLEVKINEFNETRKKEEEEKMKKEDSPSVMENRFIESTYEKVEGKLSVRDSLSGIARCFEMLGEKPLPFEC